MQLFDQRGWRVPSRLLTSQVESPYQTRYLSCPEIEYRSRLGRLYGFASSDLVFPCFGEFEKRIETLIQRVRQDSTVSNLLRGTCLPICLPRIAGLEYGQALREIFLPILTRSYAAQFPEHSFFNGMEERSADKLSIVRGSKHQRLIERMSEAPVVALYFPTALQGFSVAASRLQMADLPGDILLCGGIDVVAALALYPDILARDARTPDLVMAALSSEEMPEQAWSLMKMTIPSLSLNSVLNVHCPMGGAAPGLLVIEDANN